MADELLNYTATRQGTTVNRRPEVRGENAVNGGVSMNSSSKCKPVTIRNGTGSLKVEGTDEDK